MILKIKNRRNLGGGDCLAANNLTNEVRQIRQNFLYSVFVTFLISTILIPQITHAAPKSRSFESNAIDVSAVIPGTEGMSEMEVIQTLKHDIELLDEELRTCERKKKGWVAATVVGGVGVVGTGIAALVQNSNIQDKKSEVKRIQDDINSTNQEIERVNKELGSK